MTKVHLDITEAARPQMGIAQYERNIAEGLRRLGKYDLDFVAHRTDVTDLPFRVRRGFFPKRFFYDHQRWHRFCPISYNTLAGDFHSDISIFFQNMMPVMRIRGKSIGVIHDLLPFRIPDVLINDCKWFTRSSLDSYCRKHEYLAGHATRIVTVSEFSRREIAKEFGVKAESISVVPNGVDPARFAQLRNGDTPENEVRSKYGLPDRFILYFGTTAKYKNVEKLIRGYAKLPGLVRRNVALVITHGNRRLNEVAKEAGVSDKVRFLGFIPEGDKPSLYRLATAFGFLSSIEGFGIPPLEAMASGVPTLVSNCTTLPEVVGDGAMIVDPDDFVGIAENFERMIDDVPFRMALIERGQRRARHFTWKAASLKMANVIDQLCQ